MAHILIIEDNAENLELMTYLLNAFGHTSVSAMSAEEGMLLALSEAPDLILCDIQLPGADGYTVAQALKAAPESRRIPLIAVTALAMVGDREKGLAAGFDGYLFKPIDPQKFVAHVETWLHADMHGSRPRPHAATGVIATNPTPHTLARILVVDDSLVNRELIRDTLTPFGYEVWLASSVKEGLDLARQQRPDMIVSDLHMPNHDGFDLIRFTKQDPMLATLPFLMITSSVWGEKDRERALEQGVSRFVLRPIEPHLLLEHVAACLALRHTPGDPGKAPPP